MLLNRFIVCSKRLLHSALYLSMLALIILLTVIYKNLPTSSKEADIRIALYFEDDSDAADRLAEALLNDNSVYKFHIADDKDSMIDELKAGRLECAYVIPDGFFTSYATGDYNNPILQYYIPASTLLASINEVMFSHILEITGADVLAGLYPEGDRDAIVNGFSDYVQGENVFRLSDVTSGSFDYQSEPHRISLPVFEVTVVLAILAALLSQLIYMEDSERGIYIALSAKERISIRLLLAASSLLPLLAIGGICFLVTYGVTKKLLTLLLTVIIAAFCSILLSALMKKSTLYLRVLPLIVLFSIVITFVVTILY